MITTVRRTVGYEPNGIEHNERRGEIVVTEKFRMSRSHFHTKVRRDDIEIIGDEPVRGLLGITR